MFCFLISYQIYVEIERARLIRKLAKIKEEQGLISEAADLMQEVAVSIGFGICIYEKNVHLLIVLSFFSNQIITSFMQCEGSYVICLFSRWKLLEQWQRPRKLHLFLNR